MGRAARGLLAALGLALLTGCSEEDRRAWVSILPLPQDQDTTGADGGPAGEFSIASDSSAVLLGADTLFTRARVPGRAAIVEILPSPDSTSVAFVTGADRSAVGVWSRTRQIAAVAEAYPGGGAASLVWSPDGRYLAYRGTPAAGVSQAGVFDAVDFRPESHPLLSWFTRSGKATTPQSWIDAGRLRLLVAAGAEPEGGLAYSWELGGGTLLLEAHLAPLAQRAPPGSVLDRGGVFSLDLVGDGGPETVALYRGRDGGPSALLLESRGSDFRVTATSPLVPPEGLGLESWEPIRRGALLYQIADVGGRPTLLLDLPSSAPLRAIGLFQAAPSGRVEPMTVEEGDPRPAIFFDGIFGDVTSQLGLVDLDDDGRLEVVSAVGQASTSTLEPVLEWTVTPYRAREGRLVPAPDLRDSALASIQRALERH
ncbi:MAG TPA: hypothetical protein VFS53_01295 [Gemmatimonadota bacterium]|nr:hypothetical protein [Gemmatimonadota bacterium]